MANYWPPQMVKNASTKCFSKQNYLPNSFLKWQMIDWAYLYLFFRRNPMIRGELKVEFSYFSDRRWRYEISRRRTLPTFYPIHLCTAPAKILMMAQCKKGRENPSTWIHTFKGRFALKFRLKIPFCLATFPIVSIQVFWVWFWSFLSSIRILFFYPFQNIFHSKLISSVEKQFNKRKSL